MCCFPKFRSPFFHCDSLFKSYTIVATTQRISAPFEMNVDVSHRTPRTLEWRRSEFMWVKTWRLGVFLQWKLREYMQSESYKWTFLCVSSSCCSSLLICNCDDKEWIFLFRQRHDTEMYVTLWTPSSSSLLTTDTHCSVNDKNPNTYTISMMHVHRTQSQAVHVYSVYWNEWRKNEHVRINT